MKYFIMLVMLVVATASNADGIYTELGRSTVNIGLPYGVKASMPTTRLTLGKSLTSNIDIEAFHTFSDGESSVTAATVMKKINDQLPAVPIRANVSANINSFNGFFVKAKNTFYEDYTIYGKVGVAQISGVLNGEAVYNGIRIPEYNYHSEYKSIGMAYALGSSIRVSHSVELSFDYSKYKNLSGYPVSATSASLLYTF